MMRTRLALHAPVTRRFIILESNVTFSGRSKPLHARLNLTADECEQYNVVVLNVVGERLDCKGGCAVRLSRGDDLHLPPAVIVPQLRC